MTVPAPSSGVRAALGALAVVALTGLAACGQPSPQGPVTTMDAAQAGARVEQKAHDVVGLLPGLPTARPRGAANVLNCSDENQPPEQKGVSVSRDYVLEPVTSPEQARSILEAGFAALTARGYTVVLDERTVRAPGFIVQDPADDFRVGLTVAVTGTYTTLGVSSPCVTPGPGLPPG